MTASDPIKQAWQTSVTEAQLPPIEEVRAGADRFFRQIRLRNRIEYGAAAFVVICFTVYVFMLPSPVARIGAALVVAATLFVVWQLHRRASAVAPPEVEGTLPLLVHQRAQLGRQRDALAKVWLWYLLPFAPGMGLMIFAPAIERGPAVLRDIPWAGWVTFALTWLVFTGIWWLNRLAARKLSRGVDELDNLLGETE
jgi:hypothetical protein